MNKFKLIEGKEYLVLSQKQWDKTPADYKAEFNGEQTVLYLDKNGFTSLARVIIEG